MGLVNFTAPMERDVRGINLQTGRGLIIAAGQTEEIEPGTWEFSVLERGSTIGKRVLDVASPISMSLPSALEDPVRGSIVHALKYNDPGSSVVDFSESLGETANRDLGLWLTVMAAAHIIGPGNFEKLGDLSLAGFDDIGPNMTGLYVIAGLEHYGGVNVHTGGDWTKLAPVPALFKISHAKLEAAPGQVLFSVELVGHEVRTFPTWMLPNRVTLIVLSLTSPQIFI